MRMKAKPPCPSDCPPSRRAVRQTQAVAQTFGNIPHDISVRPQVQVLLHKANATTDVGPCFWRGISGFVLDPDRPLRELFKPAHAAENRALATSTGPQ